MRTALELLVATMLVAGGALGYRHFAGELAAAREEARTLKDELLHQEDLNAADRVDLEVLAADRDELAARFPGIQAQLERLQRVARDARVTATASLTTGPVVVPEPVAPEGGQPSPFRPATDRCLVAPGDRVELRAGLAQLELREGSQVLVAAGWCGRVSPAPEVPLAEGELRGPFHVPVTPAPSSGGCGWGERAAICAACAGGGVLATAVFDRRH